MEPPTSGVSDPLPGEPSPTAVLWGGLDDDVPHEVALPLLCGVHPERTEDLALLALAFCREAAEFVDWITRTGRNLTHQTTVTTERCVGHIRGPIQWSETITAWSSGLGVNDVFVCGSLRRDFDTAENRLVKWLLSQLKRACAVDLGEHPLFDQPERRDHLRAMSGYVADALAIPHLRTVPAQRPSARDLRKTTTGRHAKDYHPALVLMQRYRTPFTAELVESLCDAETRAQHRTVTLLLGAVKSAGHSIALLTPRSGALQTGLVRYRHQDSVPSATSPSLTYAGLTIHTRPSESDGVVVANERDAGRVVEWAISRATGPGQSTSGFVQLSGS